jgi:hypothetical protein
MSLSITLDTALSLGFGLATLLIEAIHLWKDRRHQAEVLKGMKERTLFSSPSIIRLQIEEVICTILTE